MLICSLLLTAIWVQIGTMDVKQAVGGQTATDNKKNPTMWAKLAGDGRVTFLLQDVPRKARRMNKRSIKGTKGTVDVVALEEYVSTLKTLVPDLRTALIQPKQSAVYEEIIVLMDHFKKNGMVDLGVAPL